LWEKGYAVNPEKESPLTSASRGKFFSARTVEAGRKKSEAAGAPRFGKGRKGARKVGEIGEEVTSAPRERPFELSKKNKNRCV